MSHYDNMMAGKTAAELREMAAGHRRKAHESFERCDTDGFLSQWSDGLTSELYREQANILDAGGVYAFTGLYEGDRRVKAKLISQPAYNAPWRMDYVWLVDRSDPVAAVRRYIPEGEKSRVQKKMGLSERKEMAPAKAIITGKGTGLSGSAWVTVIRAGDEWGGDAVLVTDSEDA